MTVTKLVSDVGWVSGTIVAIPFRAGDYVECPLGGQPYRQAIFLGASFPSSSRSWGASVLLRESRSGYDGAAPAQRGRQTVHFRDEKAHMFCFVFLTTYTSQNQLITETQKQIFFFNSQIATGLEVGGSQRALFGADAPGQAG